MKIQITHILSIILALLFTSCAATKNAEVNQISSSETHVVSKTIVGEVKVDLTKPISGKAVLANGNIEDAKAMATWNALQSSGSHIMIDPIYKVTQVDLNVTCEVKGYYAEYSDIRTATDQDLLDFIKVKLVTGNGLLDVPFSQFSTYYYSVIESQNLDSTQVLTEDELYSFYMEELYGKNTPVLSETNTGGSPAANGLGPEAQRIIEKDFDLSRIRSKKEYKADKAVIRSLPKKQQQLAAKVSNERYKNSTRAVKKALKKKWRKESPLVRVLIWVLVLDLILLAVLGIGLAIG
ncbi:MAG: hypothetical protein WDZ35_10355 [Crocinitomicaceae bacterium]